MSAGNTTTNYGLPIYGANDIPKWDDTNTPFGNIDSALKGVVDDLTASDNLKFKFTKSGASYGYLDVNGNFVPFKSPTGNKSITISNTGTTSGIDVADYATASVITSGLSPTPSGTKNIYSNGTYDVSNYASAYVNVSSTPNISMYARRVKHSSTSAVSYSGYYGSPKIVMAVLLNSDTESVIAKNSSGTSLISVGDNVSLSFSGGSTYSVSVRSYSQRVEIIEIYY